MEAPQDPNQKGIEILLVEDSSGDARLTEEALKESKHLHHFRRVQDGVEALRSLHRKDMYANLVLPDLILLDLNLPKKDGREVLAEIKADPVLKHIPVIVLTTSKAEEDVWKAYDLHANCYVTKPGDLAHYMRVVKGIMEFWVTIVKLPSPR